MREERRCGASGTYSPRASLFDAGVTLACESAVVSRIANVSSGIVASGASHAVTSIGLGFVVT